MDSVKISEEAATAPRAVVPRRDTHAVSTTDRNGSAKVASSAGPAIALISASSSAPAASGAADSDRSNLRVVVADAAAASDAARPARARSHACGGVLAARRCGTRSEAALLSNSRATKRCVVRRRIVAVQRLVLVLRGCPPRPVTSAARLLEGETWCAPELGQPFTAAPLPRQQPSSPQTDPSGPRHPARPPRQQPSSPRTGPSRPRHPVRPPRGRRCAAWPPLRRVAVARRAGSILTGGTRARAGIRAGGESELVRTMSRTRRLERVNGLETQVVSLMRARDVLTIKNLMIKQFIHMKVLTLSNEDHVTSHLRLQNVQLTMAIDALRRGSTDLSWNSSALFEAIILLCPSFNMVDYLANINRLFENVADVLGENVVESSVRDSGPRRE